MSMMPTRHISIAINRPLDEVYKCVANPINLPQWASGLSNGQLVQKGDDWVVETPMGVAKVRFVEPNQFGVVDHDVTLAADEVMTNPMRVIRNGTGSEVIFTLFRRPGMTDGQFEKDAAWVEKDLKQLKKLLEG